MYTSHRLNVSIDMHVCVHVCMPMNAHMHLHANAQGVEKRVLDLMELEL